MKHLKLYEEYEKENFYELPSVKMYIDTEKMVLYPAVNGKPDMQKGVSLDDMPDSWFDKLNDFDFGTVDSAINNRNN